MEVYSALPRPRNVEISLLTALESSQCVLKPYNVVRTCHGVFVKCFLGASWRLADIFNDDLRFDTNFLETIDNGLDGARRQVENPATLRVDDFLNYEAGEEDDAIFGGLGDKTDHDAFPPHVNTDFLDIYAFPKLSIPYDVPLLGKRACIEFSEAGASPDASPETIQSDVEHDIFKYIGRYLDSSGFYKFALGLGGEHKRARNESFRTGGHSAHLLEPMPIEQEMGAAAADAAVESQHQEMSDAAADAAAESPSQERSALTVDAHAESVGEEMASMAVDAAAEGPSQEMSAVAFDAPTESSCQEAPAMAVDAAVESSSQEMSGSADAAAQSTGEVMAAAPVDDVSQGRMSIAQVPQLIDANKGCTKPLLFVLVLTTVFTVVKRAGKLTLVVRRPDDFVCVLHLVGMHGYRRESTKKTRDWSPEMLARILERDNNSDFQLWLLEMRIRGKTVAGPFNPAWGPPVRTQNDSPFWKQVSQNLVKPGFRPAGPHPPARPARWSDYQDVSEFEVDFLRSEESPEAAAEYDRIFASTPESA